MPRRGLLRAVHAIAVHRAPAAHRAVAVPDLVGVLGQGYSLVSRLLGIEHAKLDRGRMSGEQGKVAPNPSHVAPRG